MTIAIRRPDSTLGAGGWTPSTGTLHGVTSDQNVATFAAYAGALGSPMTLGLADYALASGERLRRFRVFQETSSSDTSSMTVEAALTSPQSMQTASSRSGAGTTALTTNGGWRSPSSDPTVADLESMVIRSSQTFREGAANARVHELWVELDIRARPVIGSVVVTDVLGVPTTTVEFTYNTSGETESVDVRNIIRDADGAVVDDQTQSVSGSDFAAEVVTFQPPGGALTGGTYTAETTVTAFGFVAPSTYSSVTVVTTFGISGIPVTPPSVVCSADQERQLHELVITQLDDSIPPDTDCLLITAADVAFVAGPVDETVIVAGTPRHVSVWIGDEMVTTEVEFDGSNVHVRFDATGAGTARVVVAHTDTGENVRLVAQTLGASGTVLHDLDTTDVVVQLIDTVTRAQTTAAVGIVGPNAIDIDGAFVNPVLVLVLGDVSTGEECVPTQDIVVPPGLGQTVAHQFAGDQLLVTLVDVAGQVVWTNVESRPLSITVDNPTGANLIAHLSGVLASWDDVDQLRAEVWRNGELVPLDNQGELVPAFDTGELVVTDRFAPRCAINPTYGPVDGLTGTFRGALDPRAFDIDDDSTWPASPGETLTDNDGVPLTTNEGEILTGDEPYYRDGDWWRISRSGTFEGFDVQRGGWLVATTGLAESPFADVVWVVLPPLPPGRWDCEVDCCTEVTYQVRLYGRVADVIIRSDWVVCSPAPIAHDGRGWLRHPTNPDLDYAGCVARHPWDRIRPFGSQQAVDGGLPFVTTGERGGRNHTLVLPVRTTEDLLVAEAALAAPVIFYQPVDPCLPGPWLALNSSTVSDRQLQGRPHDIQQPTVEVAPNPVVLPVPPLAEPES